MARFGRTVRVAAASLLAVVTLAVAAPAAQAATSSYWEEVAIYDNPRDCGNEGYQGLRQHWWIDFSCSDGPNYMLTVERP